MSFNFLSGFLPGNILSKLRGEYINDEMREMVLQSGMFDEDYYFRKYPDVKNAGQDALQHYLSCGWKEGRNPSEEFDTFYYLRNNPDVIKQKTNPLVHFLMYGKTEGRKCISDKAGTIIPKSAVAQSSQSIPKKDSAEHEVKIILESGFFDEEYYLRQYQDLKSGHLKPARHYHLYGWKEKRNPSEKFNTAFYLEKYPDVRKSEINPLLHFLKFGMAEGRKPLPGEVPEQETQNTGEKPLENNRTDKHDEVSFIRESGLFDEEYYLNENPDVKESGADPIEHYCEFGWKEGRNPSPDFNTVFYFQEYEDVKEGGGNPLLHYIKFGRGEGRKIVSSGAIPGSKNKNQQKHNKAEEQDELLIRNSGLFDEAFYLESYPEVAKQGNDPIEHYCSQGWKDLKNPSLKFDTAFYLEQNPDIRKAGMNPLLHYIKSGIKEWRQPLSQKSLLRFMEKRTTDELTTLNENLSLIKESDFFDEDFYLSNYIDVKSENIDPVKHYYFLGWRDGRNPGPEFDTDFYLEVNEDVRISGTNPLVHYLKFGRAEGRDCKAKYISDHEKSEIFEPANPISLGASDVLVRAIAFYLPQFHPIPENDEWWGKGFTEWDKVVRARPMFQGHHQPHLPVDLGFYDLRIPDVMEQQVEMAKKFGLDGFCFYYYWFDGKRLLEKPLDLFLEHKDWDISFCVCWANENWSRRWDGKDKDILIAQRHSAEDDLAFIKDVSKYLQDPRYIHIDGKPLLVIYRPDLFPDIKRSVSCWKKYYRKQFGKDLHLAMIQSFGSYDPRDFGFDQAIEFPPHNVNPLDITSEYKAPAHKGKIYNTQSIREKASGKLEKTDYNLFRGVMLNWDNTPRKGVYGNMYINNSPELFGQWFEEACYDSIRNITDHNKRLVFINAWNEWAEGTHLEPDDRYGYAYLNAVKRSLNNLNKVFSKKVSVVVPNYNHAKFLKQRLDSIYEQSYKNFEVILLDDCSDDDSREILKEYQEKYPDKTRLILNDQNSGSVFRQWVKGILSATGELIWIAESDDFCELDFLVSIVPIFSDDAVLLAYSNTVFVNTDGEARSNSFLDYVQTIDEEKWKADYKETSYLEVRLALGLKNTIPNVSSVLFRRPGNNHLFNRKEWLDMKISGDWIFYLNIAAGGKIAYTTKTKSYYRIHEENASVKTYTRDVYYREHEMVAVEIARNYKVPEALLFENRNIISEFYKNYYKDGKNDFEELFGKNRMIESMNERKLNIAISILSFTHGGAEIMPIRLANQLKLMGYPVVIHSLEFLEEEKHIRKLLRSDIPVIRCKTPEALYEFLMYFGIEVINTHSQLCQDIFSETVEKYPFIEDQIAHVGTLHGGYEVMDDNYLKVHVPRNNENTRFWTYVADKNLDAFTKLGFDLKNKSKKIVNGIEKPEILQIERKDLGISSGSFVLCLVSRAITEKGWREAIEIVRLARENSEKEIHLLLLGNGPLYEELKSDILPNYVHLMGFQEFPCNYFSISDVGFLPSTYKAESFPLSIIEALSVGIPVVASDLGEVKNMLQINDGYAGEIFKLENGKVPVKDVAVIVSCLANDRNRYDDLRQKAKKISRRYELKNVACEYLDVYQESLKT